MENGGFFGYSHAGVPSTASLATGPAASLQVFHSKDAFVCKTDGRLAGALSVEIGNQTNFIVVVRREIERCVRKMDHFCPW